MSRKSFGPALLLVFFCIMAMACRGTDNGAVPRGRVVAVTSLFPLYDFSKNVAGSRADVSLLLPPGVEPHGFEPKPAELLKLNAADVFIFTSPDMEPWAADLIKGVQSGKLLVVNAGLGILPQSDRPRKEVSHVHRGHAAQGHGDGTDPHIWLDFGNAMKIVDNIRDGLAAKDPAGKDVYEKNAASYNEKLKELDDRYRATLRDCKVKTLLTGGHFAFHYLAVRYGLGYDSVYGFSPDAEPTPGSLARLTQTLRRTGSRYLFYEELLNPRVARAIASEAGVSLLRLHGAHNLTREEFDRGETFIGIMNRNLDSLKTGLECP